MAYKKKTAREKLSDSKDLPKIVRIEGNQEMIWGKGTMVIPAPMEVNEIMKRVPKGKLITINHIREILAKKHKATIGCPITTGIFASIAAQAAEEDKKDGKKNITPYWRTVKGKGEINDKYPGGAKALKIILESEGHNVIKKGKKYFVSDFERYLVNL